MLELTTRHKIRLWIGIMGSSSSYGYFFDIPDFIRNKRLRRILYQFMYHIGSPILNKLIGYREGDWRK